MATFPKDVTSWINIETRHNYAEMSTSFRPADTSPYQMHYEKQSPESMTWSNLKRNMEIALIFRIYPLVFKLSSFKIAYPL